MNDDIGATSPNMSEYVPEEEELAAVDVSSDGDYEEPAGGGGARRRRGGSASAAAIAGKSTGTTSKKRSSSTKSEPGTAKPPASRPSKKPKFEEDPSVTSAVSASGGLSPGGVAPFHPPSTFANCLLLGGSYYDLFAYRSLVFFFCLFLSFFLHRSSNTTATH